MSQTAAHLVDHVISHVPLRQWVLSLPIPLRVLPAAQPELVTPVLQVVQRVVTRHLLEAVGLEIDEGHGGAVTPIQRFGSAANLNIHRAHEHGPQPVKHGPYGLVGTDLESALQTQRGDSVLAGGEEPAGGEPQGQGHTRAVEDRCGGDGASHTARGALETPIAQSPAVTPQASRTNEPGGPTQPLEVIQAVGIGSKPSLKLPERPWVVRPCAWMVHPASLPVSPVKLKFPHLPPEFLCSINHLRWISGFGF